MGRPAAARRGGRRRGVPGSALSGRRQRAGLLGAALAAALWAAVAAPALAAFLAGAGATATFSSYAVPTPANARCTGLGLLRGTISWSAVSAPSGAAVDYVVTPPDGRAVAVAGTRYALPAVQLLGQYRVQARVGGAWASAAATVTVTLGAGGVYVCA